MKSYQFKICKLKPELFFLITALVFGLLILLITPPFQSPDEINHFYRSYQIADGQLIAMNTNNRVGGYIPVSLIKVTEPFLYLRWNGAAKIQFETIFSQFNRDLEPGKKEFTDFPNTALYSPISYIPQSVGIFILKCFNLSPIGLFYGARIFSLLFWIGCISYAIKIIPIYKWLFVFIALLPMSIFINMSLSADVLTNCISFLFIAYILKLTFNQQLIEKKQFIIILLFAVILSSAKMVYTPLILLFLLIPGKNFYSLRVRYIQMAVLFLIALVTIFFWAMMMNNLYLPYAQYNKGFRDGITIISCADMHLQMQYILNNGFYLLNVFYNSLTAAFKMYAQGYIGTFGWLDTFLPVWFIVLSYFVLLTIAIANGSVNHIIKTPQRFVLIFSAVVMICLILLSQHLTWDCVGSDTIYTIQGRYLIPVFPLFFILCFNKRLICLKIVIPLTIIFSIFSLSLTVHTLYKRYYKVNQTEKLAIFQEKNFSYIYQI